MRLGATPRSLLALGVLGACYAPSELTGAPCDPNKDNCPSGQACVTARDGTSTCQFDHGTDARHDGPGGDSGPNCFGSGLVQNVCLMSPPTGTLSLSISINTATVGSPNCTSIEPQSGGPSLCVIAAETINVDAGHVVTAVGSNPLVLIATGAITINGTLDVASHGTTTRGPGAPTMCSATGINGTDAPNGSGNGAGGGAGGSFGTTGGTGGKGHNNVNGGVFGPATSPIVLIGGCPGGNGGNGDGLGGVGPGGAGGGGVYLISNASITVGGAIDASGSGGGGGGAGVNSGGGGGGGGAGGFIGLDAPTIAVTGSIYANGGGGGGGNGNQPDQNGQPGADPTTATVQANGGNGGGGGGASGGKGYANGSNAGNGNSVGSCNTTPACAGGGGGGGAGIIRGYRGTLTGGTISPPAS